MENSVKSSENTQPQIQNLNPVPTPVQAPQSSTRIKKRPLESYAQLQDSTLFKIRALVRDLRPQFLEVLRTPDFRSCKEAHDIQEKLKLLIALYKQLKSEKLSTANCNGTSESQPTVENGFANKTQDQPRETTTSGRPPRDKLHYSVKPPPEVRGTYMVGGSAFGWNFITFAGSEPVYYGRTKEATRIAQANGVARISENKTA